MRKLIVLGLFAILSTGFAATPAAMPVSVDSKTELAGIKLGQNVGSLDKSLTVVQQNNTSNPMGVDPADISDATPNSKSVLLRPKAGATYGGLPIKTIWVYAIYDTIVNIRLDLASDPKSNLEKSDLDEKMAVIAAGLTLKYGNPDRQTCPLTGTNGTYVLLNWKGKDIALSLDPFSRSITINSNKLFDQARVLFVKKNEEALQRYKREAAKIVDGL